MQVAILTVELAIYESMSLKDKRRVIKSLKDRLAHRFNVSVAEVDHADTMRRATLGIAMVSNDTRHLNQALDKMLNLIRAAAGVSLIDVEREIV